MLSHAVLERFRGRDSVTIQLQSLGERSAMMMEKRFRLSPALKELHVHVRPKLKYYFFNKFQNPFQKMVCGVLGNLGTPAVKHVALDLVLGVGLASAQNK